MYSRLSAFLSRRANVWKEGPDQLCRSCRPVSVCMCHVMPAGTYENSVFGGFVCRISLISISETQTEAEPWMYWWCIFLLFHLMKYFTKVSKSSIIIPLKTWKQELTWGPQVEVAKPSISACVTPKLTAGQKWLCGERICLWWYMVASLSCTSTVRAE